MLILILQVTLAIAVVIWLCSIKLRSLAKVDPQEPPYVAPQIPVVGHAIGLLKKGAKHWVDVYEKNPLPIFTATIFKRKLYVVTSLELVKQIQRQTKTISFAPFVTMTAEKLSQLPQEKVSLFKKSEKREGCAADTIKAVEGALRQADLDEMMPSMLDSLKERIDELPMGEPVELHAWVRHHITIGSTRSIYGPHNPFQDRAVEDAFWVFEHKASVLMNGFVPGWAAHEGLNARDTVARALGTYFAAGYHRRGSALAQAKYDAPALYGLDPVDIGLVEVPFLIGVLNNTVPTMFWSLCAVLASSPSLIHKMREEVSQAVERDGSRFIIDIGQLKSRTSLPLSIYHETLRQRNSFSASRFVMEDTWIKADSGSYLLKAGAVVQVPADIIHADTESWGSDASQTDLERFTDPLRKKKHPLAFRSFGGSPYICPGRQFATTEVIATMAMLVMRFDITPAGDKWELPPQNVSMFGSVPPPKGDVKVIFREREGWQGEWSFEKGEAGLPWNLESG